MNKAEDYVVPSLWRISNKLKIVDPPWGREISPEQLADFVKTVLPLLNEIPIPLEIVDPPRRSKIRLGGIARGIRFPTLVFESKWRPDWHHEAVSYPVKFKSASGGPSKYQFIDYLLRHRTRAATKLAKRILQRFKQPKSSVRTDHGGPTELIVLKYDWLRETVVLRDNKITVYLDATFAIPGVPTGNVLS